jgi:hypothetical protein
MPPAAPVMMATFPSSRGADPVSELGALMAR